MTLAARVAGWPQRNLPQEVLLALGLGCVLAVAVQLLPWEASLVVGLVACLAALAMVDLRVAVIALVAARSTLDATTALNLASAGLPANVNATALLSGALVILGLAHLATHRVVLSKIPLAKPFGALLGVFSLAILYAPDAGLALEEWLRALSVFVLYLLVVDLLKDDERPAPLIGALVVSVVPPSLFGLYELVAGIESVDAEGFSRIAGTFAHPAIFAIYLVTLLPIVAVVFLHTPSRLVKLLVGLLMALMLVCLVATFTRGAWLGLVVAVLVMVAARPRAVFLLLPVLALLMFIAVPGVQERSTSLTGENSSLLWRTNQWGEALSVGPPWQLVTGAGLGAVSHALGNETHNDYVRVLVEGGVLGIAAFLWLYVSLTKIVIAGYGRLGAGYQRDLVLAFIAILASRAVMLFSDNLIGHPVLEWYFWSLAAVVVALCTKRSGPEVKPAKAALVSGGGGR